MPTLKNRPLKPHRNSKIAWQNRRMGPVFRGRKCSQKNVHGPPRKASTSRPAGRLGPSFSSRCMADETGKKFFSNFFGKKIAAAAAGPDPTFRGPDRRFCVLVLEKNMPPEAWGLSKNAKVSTEFNAGRACKVCDSLYPLVRVRRKAAPPPRRYSSLCSPLHEAERTMLFGSKEASSGP